MTDPPSSARLERLLDVHPSFALLAGMQLEIFTHLTAGPLNLAGLATALGVEKRRLRPLIYALAAMDLLQIDRGPDGTDAFANGPEAEAYLVRGRPGYLGGLHPLYAQLWEGGLQAAASIHAGRPLVAHDMAAMDPKRRQAFFDGLHPDALATGKSLAQRSEWTACKNVLDVGGGSGGVAIALAQTHPRLQATVLEQATVAPLTRRFIADAGLADRIKVQVQDPVAGPPQGHFDAAIFKSFLQVLGPQDAARAVAHVVTCLRPGGQVYILGQGLIDDNRQTPVGAVIANLVFPSFYPEGQAYTEGEHRTWLTAAGCTQITREQLEGAPLLVARRG